jgi:hypothetical protein
MVGFMINRLNLKKSLNGFIDRKPFPYAIIDKFLDNEIALHISSEFLNFEYANYNGQYNNPIELKNTCNIWDRFPKYTYKLIDYLNSVDFVNELSTYLDVDNLRSDPGLHGGGMHLYPSGGKLNPHLDYETHPKLNLTRKYNLLIYLTQGWKKEWGGNLGFWSSDDNNEPKNLDVEISPLFNRAVLFDTVNSWHGLSNELSCPKNITRNSIAIYYLSNEEISSKRQRALFYPTEDQKNNKEILNLIERRSIVDSSNVENWSRK